MAGAGRDGPVERFITESPVAMATAIRGIARTICQGGQGTEGPTALGPKAATTRTEPSTSSPVRGQGTRRGATTESRATTASRSEAKPTVGQVDRPST